MTDSELPTVPTIEVIRVFRVLQEAGFYVAHIEREAEITTPGLLNYLDKNIRDYPNTSQPIYDKLVAFANRTVRERPGHVWAVADDMAGRIHDACRMMVRSRTVSLQEIEAETGILPKTQERIRDVLGITYLTTRHPQFEDMSVTRLIETRDGAFERLAVIVEKLDVVFEAEGDLVLECLRLGLMGVHSNRFGESLVPKITVTHPSAVAWRAEQARSLRDWIAAA